MDSSRLKYPAYIVLVVLAVYLPVLFSGKVLVDDPSLLDISFNFMPNIWWMKESWLSGHFPLWNTHTFCGMPQLGYSHCGALYPVNALLFIFLPYLTAGSASIIIHSAIAAVLFFYVLTDYEISPHPACAAAVTYVLSGAFFGLINEFWLLGTMTGFFASWLFLRKFLRRNNLKYALLSAFAVAWTGLSGDTELMVYAFLFLYLLFFLEAGPSLKKRLRTIFIISFPVVMGGLLMTAMALHALVTARYSIRGDWFPFAINIETQSQHFNLGMPLWLAPFKYNLKISGAAAFNNGLSALYQGFLIPWAMVVVLAMSFKNKIYRPLTISFLVLTAYVVLKDNTLLAPFFSKLPLLGDFHFQTKAATIIHASSIALVFLWLNHAGSSLSRFRVFGWVLLIAGFFVILNASESMMFPVRLAIGIAAAGLGLYLAIKAFKAYLRPRPYVFAAALLLAVEAFCLAWCHVPRTDPKSFELPEMLAEYAQGLSREDRYVIFEQLLSEKRSETSILGSFEVESGAGNIVGPARVAPYSVFYYLTLLYGKMLIPIDENQKILNMWSITNPGTLERSNMHLLHLAGVEHIVSRDMPVPFTSPYSLLRKQAVTYIDMGGKKKSPRTSKGTLDIAGPQSLEVKGVVLEGDRLVMQAKTNDKGWLFALGNKQDHKASLLSARHLTKKHKKTTMTTAPLSRADSYRMIISWVPPQAMKSKCRLLKLQIINPHRAFQMIKDSGKIQIYENIHAMPRVFPVRDFIAVSSLTHALRVMDDPQKFQPSRKAIIPHDRLPGPLLKSRMKTAGPLSKAENAKLVKYGPQRAHIKTKLAAPAAVIFTDTYFPGWNVYEIKNNGKLDQIEGFPANMGFRGFYAETSARDYCWLYGPVSFRVGLWSSLAALFALLAAACIGIIKPRITSRNYRPLS